MNVEEITFAAHVDYTHNSQFIETIDANHIVLIHLSVLMETDTGPWRTSSDGKVKKCIIEQILHPKRSSKGL